MTPTRVVSFLESRSPHIICWILRCDPAVRDAAGIRSSRRHNEHVPFTPATDNYSLSNNSIPFIIVQLYVLLPVHCIGPPSEDSNSHCNWYAVILLWSRTPDDHLHSYITIVSNSHQLLPIYSYQRLWTARLSIVRPELESGILAF